MTNTNEMHGRVITVFPEMARDMLTRNKAGRRLNKAHVRELAGETQAGRWLLTHQGIALDGPDWFSSNLLDGQHRLEMIVANETPQELFVVFNVPPEAFKAMDLAMRRTGAQTAEMELRAAGLQTVNPVSRLASQARIILLHGQGQKRPSNSAVSEFVRAHKDILDRYAPVVKEYTAGAAAAFSYAEISGFGGVQSAARRLLDQVWEKEQQRDPMRALSNALRGVSGQGDKSQKVRFHTALAALEYVDRGEGLDIAKKYDAPPKRVSSRIQAHAA
jgi:hypothetical protein